MTRVSVMSVAVTGAKDGFTWEENHTGNRNDSLTAIQSECMKVV